MGTVGIVTAVVGVAVVVLVWFGARYIAQAVATAEWPRPAVTPDRPSGSRG